MWNITKSAALSERFSYGRLGCGLVLLVPLLLLALGGLVQLSVLHPAPSFPPYLAPR
jgi:hypothetical protein